MYMFRRSKAQFSEALDYLPF